MDLVTPLAGGRGRRGGAAQRRAASPRGWRCRTGRGWPVAGLRSRGAAPR